MHGEFLQNTQRKKKEEKKEKQEKKKKKTDSEIMNLKKRPQYSKNKWGEYSNTKLTIIF